MASKDITDEPSIKRSRRSNAQSFDWQNNCFLCGEKCLKNKRSQWSMVESSIDNASASMYSSVFNAAKLRQDEEVLFRLHSLPNGDLVAAEARYHRKKGCYASYVNSWNLQKYIKTESSAISEYEVALQKLKDEYYKKIVCNKEMVLLCDLTNKCRKYLDMEKVEGADQYRSHILKAHIEKTWDGVVCFGEKGKSDIVVSEDISIGQALRQVHDLSKQIQLSEEESLALETTKDYTDNSILHRAAGILRNSMKENVTPAPETEYYSSTEISLEAMNKFVDPELYKFIMWLIDEKSFTSAQIPGELHRRCLSIVCDVIFEGMSLYSPKHLGLGINLHWKFGSKDLIEELHSLGCSVSYKEVLRFENSASHYINSIQLPSEFGSYIPYEFKKKEEGGKLIIAVGDNWDHQEHTLDGRRTTHSMTSILVTSSTDHKTKYPRIPRLKESTLKEEDMGVSLQTVMIYEKPHVRPEPNMNVMPEVSLEGDVHALALTKATETMYSLGRSGAFSEATFPPWGKYHVQLSQGCDITHKSLSQVAYNPMILNTPTDLNTVYTLLKRVKEAANQLGHEYIPVFFDMGLLTKALEITWARPQELHGIIPCEGGMHLLMSLFAGIGSLYGSAGLQHLLHESGVYAAGTAGHIMSGKDFDRCLRALRLVDEALNSCFFQQFKRWCNRENIVIPDEIIGKLSTFEAQLKGQKNVDISLVQDLAAETTEFLLPLIEEFRHAGRMYPTFQLWDDFLSKVTLPLKIFLSASRDGDWKAYQASKAEMLPVLFASNRNNYARYLPVQLIAMQTLPAEVEEAFQDGQFVAQLSKGCFKKVWMDYTLETTQNKSLKGQGGVIGLTLRGPALLRWFLSRPVTAKYSESFELHITQTKKTADLTHHLTSPSEIKKWNDDVEKMKNMFCESYTNPFCLDEPPEHLINFASGAVATLEIEKSLLGAIQKGKDISKKFVSERLTQDPQRSFYAVLPRSGVHTMSEMNKTVTVKGKKIHINAEEMYIKLTAINAKKKVPLDRVMSFENTPYPCSIFKEDGNMLLPENKSDFLHKLESLSGNVTSVAGTHAIIFDGHAIVQLLPAPSYPLNVCCTFRDMAKKFMKHILTQSSETPEVHIVFDKYLPVSTKDTTRTKRGEDHRSYHIQAGRNIPPNWKQFLKCGENKSRLAKFYTEFICDMKESLDSNKVIYISGGKEDKVVRVMKSDVTEEPGLQSNMEEADGRLIFHCLFAIQHGAEQVVVCSPDTDILVLLVYHAESLKASSLYFKTGKSEKNTKNERYINVNDIYEKLTETQRSILLAVYCLSGCDTVSTFYGHGKGTAFNILMSKKAEQLKNLAELGKSTALEDHVKDACIRFVCLMYGDKADCKSTNELRCILASGRKKVSAKHLPPTLHVLILHILRALRQLLIWMNVLIGMHEEHDPTEYGYEMNNTQLVATMMNQSAAAPELLNDLICTCPKGRCYVDCVCLSNEQACTSECGCEPEYADISSCSNYYTWEATEDI